MAIDNRDLQTATTPKSDKGFDVNQKSKAKAKPSSENQAAALAKPTNATRTGLEQKAAEGYKALAKNTELAQTAAIKTATKQGQDLALTEEVAKTTGYLQTKASLTVAGAKKRIGGSVTVQNAADAATAQAIIEMLDETPLVEGDDDFLSELSGIEGTQLDAFLPSLA